MTETGKLINGRDIAVVVAREVRDSEDLERERERERGGGEILSVGKRQ